MGGSASPSKLLGNDAGKIVGGVISGISGGLIGNEFDKGEKLKRDAKKAAQAAAAESQRLQIELAEKTKADELEKHQGAMRRRTAFFSSQSKPRSTIFTSPLGVPGSSGGRKTLLGA